MSKGTVSWTFTVQGCRGETICGLTNPAQSYEREVPCELRHIDIKQLGHVKKGGQHRNGPAFHAAAFGTACLEQGIPQKFTRAYRPQIHASIDHGRKRTGGSGAALRV
ncbi:MAG: hypothetical protein PHI55_04825 [Burkholderiaceae bacterium]|nr:hypothetical protein [Burkholderiaceae bacterium]